MNIQLKNTFHNTFITIRATPGTWLSKSQTKKLDCTGCGCGGYVGNHSEVLTEGVAIVAESEMTVSAPTPYIPGEVRDFWYVQAI